MLVRLSQVSVWVVWKWNTWTSLGLIDKQVFFVHVCTTTRTRKVLLTLLKWGCCFLGFFFFFFACYCCLLFLLFFNPSLSFILFRNPSCHGGGGGGCGGVLILDPVHLLPFPCVPFRKARYLAIYFDSYLPRKAGSMLGRLCMGTEVSVWRKVDIF